jgi:hemolysin III
MMDPYTRKSPEQMDREDRANSYTHAIATGMSIAGLAFMVTLASLTGDPWKIVSVSIFGATLILLYASSSLYHAVRRPVLRRIFRVLDHVSINLLIAGTYTPFLLVNLRGQLGWTMFGTIWGLALAGVILEIFFTGRFKVLGTLLYIAMGWIIVFAMKPLASALPTSALVLLFAGGLSYSLGAIFYIFDKRLPFGHAIWHVFVMGGSICQFLSVCLGVIPFKP